MLRDPKGLQSGEQERRDWVNLYVSMNFWIYRYGWKDTNHLCILIATFPHTHTGTPLIIHLHAWKQLIPVDNALPSREMADMRLWAQSQRWLIEWLVSTTTALALFFSSKTHPITSNNCYCWYSTGRTHKAFLKFMLLNKTPWGVFILGVITACRLWVNYLFDWLSRVVWEELLKKCDLYICFLCSFTMAQSRWAGRTAPVKRPKFELFLINYGRQNNENKSW